MQLTIFKLIFFLNGIVRRFGALKMQDMKMTDQCAGHENAGHAKAKQKTSSEAANVRV